VTLGVALCLAPWDALWDETRIPQPPAAAGIAAGVALLVAAAVLVRVRSRRAVTVAAALDVAGALALVAWLAADAPPGRGTPIVALLAVGLVIQAVFDAVMLAGR
jgi:hypothetical protein